MANVYQAFIDAANSLHQKEPITSLSGPFWFTKLWLNSIFRKHLRQDARFSLALELEGARLVYYTSTGKPLEQSFRKYIKVLMKMIYFTKDLAPVVHLLIARPECLKKTFLIETPGKQVELIELWFGFLTLNILVAGPNIKMSYFFAYQP